MDDFLEVNFIDNEIRITFTQGTGRNIFRKRMNSWLKFRNIERKSNNMRLFHMYIQKM